MCDCNQNEMKPNENQNKEQEVVILAPTPCCSNCIIVDPANGCSVREGTNTIASGFASHAEGGSVGSDGPIASGSFSHAEGNGTLASAPQSHAEGFRTQATGADSHAEGFGTLASGGGSHAEGEETRAEGFVAHAEGFRTVAFTDYSHAEGFQTTANGNAAHAEGFNTFALGPQSHAEGEITVALGRSSHAEGGPIRNSAGEVILRTRAEGDFSHAEGRGTLASQIAAHAEGQGTRALGPQSHAEGISSEARGTASHAEGQGTTAIGTASHSEGQGTTASGLYSHAEGQGTVASGARSHAEGLDTNASGLAGAHIMGRFGDATHTYSWHLANGTSSTNRSLAAKILNDGRGIADLGWRTGNADYAELFETIDGKPMDVGYFVTLDGKKIRKATTADDYILGIVSADPAILGDSGELRWKDKYVTDEWGRVQYHDVVIPAEKDQDGNVIVPEHTEKQPILNPGWDDRREYIPRSERPEWVAVGLLGKLRVRDDGTCQVNRYCRPNNEGIATASDKGYRVMERTGPNQVLVLLK
ncbi:autotransporter adhesin [Bacillus fengqiuensis]|nr:autotransporter adhesin [Bacillus fengqiuensis]